MEWVIKTKKFNIKDVPSNTICIFLKESGFRTVKELTCTVLNLAQQIPIPNKALDRTIYTKIVNNKELNSFESAQALSGILELKLDKLPEHQKCLQQAQAYFNSFPVFIRDIRSLVSFKLEQPENSEYDAFWKLAQKKLTERTDEAVSHLIGIYEREQEALKYFNEIFKPLFAELIRIFFLHNEYFASSRYISITAVERLLFETINCRTKGNRLRVEFYYMLANLHSYESLGWRRENYAGKFAELAQQLNVMNEFPDFHRNNEGAHAGLKRLLHHLENGNGYTPSRLMQTASRRIDNQPLNIFQVEVNHEHRKIISVKSIDATFRGWEQIPEFSVLTGRNGGGKSKVLDSIDYQLRNGDKSALPFHLYANSESDMLRQVFGKAGNDFKPKYVYEKIIQYLKFTDYRQRSEITKAVDKSLSVKIALVIVDRMLCGYLIDSPNMVALLTSTIDEKNLIVELEKIINRDKILEVAEHLAFKLNALSEPISFVKNICWQHKELVTSRFSDGNTSSMRNDKDSFSSCTARAKERENIIPPIDILNSVLQKYLPSFRVDYKWIENVKYRLLGQPNELIDSSEIGIFLSNDNTINCKIRDEESPLKISSDDIDQDSYDVIFDALKKGFFGHSAYLDNSFAKLVEYTSSRNYTPGGYEFVFCKDRIELDVSQLSSGELVIIKLILWSYASRGLNYVSRIHESPDNPLPTKLGLLLLDEVDKHFDARLSKTLMEILQNEFIFDYPMKSKAQVIMVSHRFDTLALVPADSGQIFTVKQNQNVVEVTPTHKLSAIFRLTGNMREVVNFHVKVFTEAPDDMDFFQNIHRILLGYCNEYRKSPSRPSGMRGKYFSNMDAPKHPLEVRLLSNRYQPLFASTSLEGGKSGGKNGIEVMLSREIPFKRQQSEAYQKSNGHYLYDPTIETPFGFVDSDYDNQNIALFSKASLLPRCVFLNRHSLENYLFDPFIMFSVMDSKDAGEYFTEEFLNNANNFVALIGNLRGCSTVDMDELRACLKKHFNLVLSTLLNKLLKSKHSATPILRICQIMTSLRDEDLFNVVCSSYDFKDTPWRVFDSFVRTFHTRKEDYRDWGRFQSEFVPPEGEKVSDEIKGPELDLQPLVRNAYKHLGRNDCTIDNVVEKLLSDTEDIEIFFDPLKSTIKMPYPKVFLKLRGHDFEDIFVKVLSRPGGNGGNNIKTLLLSKLSITEKVAIPVDLMKCFSKLNDRIRKQVYPILKKDVRFWHPEVRELVSLPHEISHRLDVRHLTASEAKMIHKRLSRN